jgi:diguanylate cyclase (GGDEF)-like protein
MNSALGSAPTTLSLYEQADHARSLGHYATAAQLFAVAAHDAPSAKQRLHCEMRRAACLYNLGDNVQTEHLARSVADEARIEGLSAELADSLALAVKVRLSGDRCADTADELAEALHALSSVIDEPANYVVVHNVAETFQHCELPFTAIDLYLQALQLTSTPTSTAYTQASLAAAHHLAMNHAGDPAKAMYHLREGVYAATAALEIGEECDAAATATALAHRSLMLALLGHYAAARFDADRATALAKRLEFEDLEIIAYLGGALASWHLDSDPVAMDSMVPITLRARQLGLETYLLAVAPKAVDVLWQRGEYDNARAVLSLQVERLRVALSTERAARWQHVRLGVDLRLAEARSETDPLTGLHNRRYLERWLPAVLAAQPPVCVALLDLDGFKRVNDDLGHDAGDRLLSELASVLQRICRRGDAVMRIGGDEFVVGLVETSPGDSRHILERLRRIIGTRRWHGLPDSVRVTASIGAITVSGPHAVETLLMHADHALRDAKQSGRDRIVYR